MDLIDVNKKEVTLMKYIGPFSPRVPASDSETLTNIFISKGSQNLEKTNILIGDIKLSQQKLISGDENNDNKRSENLGIVIKSNMADRNRVGKMFTDVSASDQLKANLGMAGINKAVKQCTNLTGGLVDGNLASKSLHSLIASESNHLSSRILGMGGIKMAATQHLDHVTSMSGIKSDFPSSLANSRYSITSGLMDVHQNQRSGLSAANLGIKKADSDLHAVIMNSSKGLALLDTKKNIPTGGCALDAAGFDGDGKLNQDKVMIKVKSLNKGDTRIPLPAIFANCQFALDLSMNMSFSEKTNLRKAITGHGGIVSFIVTKKSTHVICGDPEKADLSYKCKMATKYGIPIIRVDYVRDCVDKGRLLNTDSYLLMGKTKAEELKLGKISASRQHKLEMKQKVRPLFNVKNVKMWTYGEKDCPVFDEKNYQIAKYAMFKKLDKSTETTTFCVLELHVVDFKVDGTSEHRFRVFCHHGALHDVEEGQAGNKEIRFAQTSEEVVAIYVHLYHEQMKPPQSMTLTFDLLSRHVGSQKFKQMMEEIGAECGVISPAVSGLVNYVWEEAVGNLQHNLRGPLASIKTEQIDKAEGILKQMREAVDEENTMRLFQLKDEFYKEIPYQQTVSISDINKAWISRTFDLCQLIRDLIAVSEATDWSARPSDEAKYSALRCSIEHLESTSPEFKTIKDYLMQSLEGGMSLKVERIFHVHRSAESANFRMDLEPRRLLFHSSRVDNFMGILSRGLLMPRVVVDDHGGKRTDPGMLGSGIYFAEAGSTSAGYSSPGKTKGTRLMLINEVALGSCFGTTKHDKFLTEPPEGYQSVHGIKATENCPSDFKVDEYVVYNTNQQKIKYLVEFTLPGDIVTAHDVGSVLQNQQLFVGRMDTDEVEDLSLKEVDLKDVASVLDPISKVKAGLVSSGDAPVDLKRVHISAQLLDMVSQVVVIQEYNNNSSSPLEAKYVFPLDEMAAICGFEAFINGKHIIGEVKEKETAHKEYKKAISEGHGAYLMDQDEETPDVFTISVGNLPPWATVFIKITYVAELQVEDELISFRLPGSVAPWSKEAALQDKTQSDLATVEVKQGRTSLLVAVEMPFDIRTIECPTHKVKLKKTLTKAVVELCDEQSLSDGFQLLIGLAEIHVPRMWVERKDIDSNHQACMLSFYPEFEASEDEESDVIFLLDLSNSMKGAALTQAKKVLLLTLTHIPKQWTFNVIVFGTGYRELFPGGVCKTPENVKKVEKFVQGLKADMGNTEALRPLHSLHLLKQESSLRNVFLITDGHVNNEETTLAEIHCHCQNTRIFTFGVSSTANRHLLRALARMGGGAFEFFDPKSKSKWEGKVKSQISKAGHIGLTSISVHWEQYNSDVAAPVQAPQNINAIFSGSRQVIYGFVPNCTMATLKAQIDGQEVSTVVSTSDLNITEGKILHRLTARAIIRDWEDGLLSLDRADQEIMKATTKNMIIELSKEYSIVTQFTSFVAIEKRDEDKEVDESDLLDMNDLIGREAGDILQSMGYLSSSSSSSSSDEVESLGELCWKSEDVMCENYVESEGINDDFCEDEWGGGGGGGGGGEMTSPLASMPRTLSREVEVMCADSHESYEYEDIFDDGDEGGMLRTFSREVMSAETVEYKDRRGEGKMDSIGMKIPRAKAMVDMSVDDSATVDNSIESDAICAVQEDSCEDMSFGLFGDADTITPSAQTSAKDEITPDSFTRMPSSSIPRTYAKIMSRKGARDTAFMSRGGESANEETFDVNIKEKQPRESLMTKMSQVSSTRMSPTSFPMTDSLNETQEGPTAESVQEQVQEEKKASSPVQPELYIVRGYMQSKPRGILRKKGTKSAAETSGVARPLPLLGEMSMQKIRRSADETVEYKRSSTLASSLVQPELDMSWRPEQEPMFEITGSVCGRSAFETQGLARQTDHIFSNSGPVRLSSAKYSERAQIKMSKKEGEAVHPRSASPAMYRPLDMRVDSKLDFPGKTETPQVGTLFESVALAPPEIQSKSLFESAPSESHVLSEGHDISQQPMFRFGASKSSTLTASFASQQMFPSPAAFGSAASKSSSLFGSGSSKKLSQNEPMHGFGAYTSSSLPDQFSSWQMFPSQEAVGFAVPSSSVPFGSQSSEKISPKELEHGFEAPTSSWSLTSLPVTASGSFFKLDASQPSQSVPQSHITFGSSSVAPAGQVIGHPSQSVPQSHITFGSPSFAPAGQVTGHPSQSVPQSHITFGSSSFAPAGQVTGQPSQSVPQSHFMFGSSSFTPTGQVTGQPVCQGHSSFGSASFTTTGPVTSLPSQQMFQSLSADRFKSFEPTGPVTSHSMLQSHPTFGFASFPPTLRVASLPSQQKFEKQSGFKCLEETETLSAPFRSQMKVESGSLFGSSSFGVAQGKFKEPQPQPQPSVLQPLPPSPPAHRICSSSISSALAPEQYVTHMEKEMMVSPVLEQRQQPPPLPRRNKTLFHLAKSTPTPIQSALNILDVQKAPPPPPPPPSLPALARNMCSFPNLEQRQQPPPLPRRNKTDFHLAKSTPTPIQSALNILDVQKAPPPPPPPSLPALARNMCSFPNLEQQLQLDRMREEQVMKSSEVQVEQNRRLREKENRRHHEEEEQSCKSLISTSPQVSWRSYSVSAFRDTRNIYQKSEVAESMGAFERIQSRSLARMEHEPLLDSLDTMEESLLIEGGMLGEPVTTDLGHYGIGLNVECIAVRPMKGLPSSTVECIMKFQKEDGHWEFDADLERILGVDKNLCLHILYTSGLKSMGESAVQAIIQLATTLIVLLSIYKHLFPSSHLINLRQVDEQNNMYNRIRTAMSKLGFGHQFDNAMAYCNRMKRQHSLVPATLELGKSWEEMVGKMLGIHCDKSDIKRQSDIISV